MSPRARRSESPGASAGDDVEESKPAPFLKWAGGKRGLLDRILKFVPPEIDTYFEPFVGGGALFFELARQPGRFKRAVLADQNEDLISCYRAIQVDVEAVMAELDRQATDQASYYRMRNVDPATLSSVERAARTIYLNKTGFNGLYRVNSSGKFNVPFGRHKGGMRLYQRGRLLEVARVLNTNVVVVPGDFEAVVAGARKGDFVYFDPPYVPVSATSNFTRYARLDFGPKDQERLAVVLRGLKQRDVPALLSNSDCEITRELYKGMRPHAVKVRRAINSVGDRRGPVSELLVRSFDYSAKPSLHGNPGGERGIERG